jgi:hypothetical protein
MRVFPRPATLLAAVLPLMGAYPDGQEIIRKTAEFDRNNWPKARELNFREKVETVYLGSDDKPNKTESVVHEVIWLEGSPYRRVVERNGNALSADEEKFEADKLKAVTGERKAETPEMRGRRIDEANKALDRNRPALREVPDAFVFTVVGEEVVNGRPSWVLTFTPKKGYTPKDKRARIFPSLRGKIWIDKHDYAWARAEAELFETFSFGWILVRVGKGSRAIVEQTRTPDGVWAQSAIRLNADARIGLVKHYRLRRQTIATNHTQDRTEQAKRQ